MSGTESMQRALGAVLEGELLAASDTQSLFEDVLAGQADPVLLAGLLVALSQRGETAEEVRGVALALRAHVQPFEHDCHDAIDTCGTGGDGLGTFNLSTAAALVAAAAGAKVVKHGNRSVSSKSGSADLLEALGGGIDVSDDVARAALAETGFTFLFAQRYHSAMRHVAPVRRMLGVRTVFNLVGPLANPGGVTRQVIGVPSPALQATIGDALEGLGVDAAYVVHGSGGADELTLAGGNRVLALGSAPELTFTADALGLPAAPVTALAGGDAVENAAILRRMLEGQPGPHRDATVLNAAAALVVAGVVATAVEGAERAVEAIDSGRARQVVGRWVEITGGAA